MTLLQLDHVLGYAEVAAVPAALGLILVALRRGGRSRCALAAGFAIVVGLTVAQPFGVKGVPITPAELAAGAPQAASAIDSHGIRVLHWLDFRFKPYTRRILYLNGESDLPTDWLKIRSRTLGGLLINGAKVERLCAAERLVNGVHWS